MENKDMIQVTQAEWNKIHNDYKGTITTVSQWNGRKSVMSGCIGNTIGELWVEGIHFIIV